MFIKKKQNMWLILSIIIISIVVLLQIIKPLHNSFAKTIETNNFNIEAAGEIVKGTKIEQTIYIPKGLKQYGVIFATYMRQNTGHIEVKIEQEKAMINEIIDVSTLLDNQMYMLKIDTSKLENGNAKLIITGIDGTEGNAVTVYASQDTSLGKMSINDKQLEKGVMQRFKINSFDSTAKIIILLSIALFLITIYVVYILCFKEENKKNSIILFLCTTAIIIIVLCIKAPMLTFKVEPFAELATNFYSNGKIYSIWNNIFITDAGYLPLLQRIVSIFIIKILRLSPVWAITLMQDFAIIFIATISSVFCLKEFSNYGNRIFRFTVSVILGTCAIVYTYYDSHSFINFTYYGIVWIILMSMIELNDLSKKKFAAVVIFSSLICISKSYYVILIPIIVLIYLLKRKEMSKRYVYYLGGMLLGSIIQLIYTMRNVNQWVKPEGKPSGLSDLVQKSLYHLVQQVINLFYPNIANVPNIGTLNLIFILIVFITLVVSVIYVYKLKNNRNIVLFALMLLCFGTSMFNVITTIWNQQIDWNKTQGAILMRHSLFIEIGIIFIVVFVIYMIRQVYENIIYKNEDIESTVIRKELKRNFKFAYFVIAFMLASRFTIFDNNDILTNDLSFSDWKIYSQMLEKQNYLIPIDPYPWMLKKNCEPYLIGPPNMIPKQQTNQIIDANAKQIHEVKLDKKVKAISVFAKRLRENNEKKLLMVIYDENDQPIGKIMQTNNVSKMNVGFIFDETKEISRISFFDENMELAYVMPEIIIGNVQ